MLRDHIVNDDEHKFVVEQNGADVVAIFAALTEYHADLLMATVDHDSVMDIQHIGRLLEFYQDLLNRMKGKEVA
jgi:hypothetical protein